ncbi:hypothetical protein [Stenotrophomonas rhizophila]|uniref:hypothetical protein n=1 Tax=Stenotrophomonas rhizophila TaxID=216778 RepID=UPI003AF7C5E9
MRINAAQKTAHTLLASFFWLALYATFLLIVFAWNALSFLERHAVSGYFIGFAFGAFAHEAAALLTGQTSEIRRYAVGIQRIYQDADDSGRPVARKRALVMSALLIAIFLLVIVGLYETIKFQLLASYTFTLTVSTLIGATGASEIAMPRLSIFQARRELRRTAKLKEPNIERDAC